MNYVKSNVVMLSTEKAKVGQIILTNSKNETIYGLALGSPKLHGNRLFNVGKYDDFYIPQHLYFTTDDEIKGGDWVIWNKCEDKENSVFKSEYKENSVFKCENKPLCSNFLNSPENKHKFSKIVASTDESLGLARPSNAFLKKYCESYNYGKAITKVNIECKLYHGIKISPDNTISIAKIEERTYTQKEVDDLLDRNTCEVTAQMINKQIFTKEEVINLIRNYSDYVDELYRKYTKNNLLAWDNYDTWIKENIK